MLLLLLSFAPAPPARHTVVSGDVVALTRETITVRSQGADKTFPLQKDVYFELPRREFGGVEYNHFSVAMGEFVLREFRLGIFKGRVDVKVLRGKAVLVTQSPPKE